MNVPAIGQKRLVIAGATGMVGGLKSDCTHPHANLLRSLNPHEATT